ncbi:hypothetical protein LCGC14_2763680, partial [marine sediment metagenome]
MNKFKLTLLVAGVLSALAACSTTTNNNEPTRTTTLAATTNTASQQLNTLVEQYFVESLQFSPLSATYIGYSQYNNQFTAPSTEQNRATQQAFYQDYQQRLAAIDKQQLTGQALLSYEILERDLALTIAGFQFPSYLLPINQMSGAHNTFAGFGSAQSAQPFVTFQDYENFISRAQGFVTWLASVQDAMRQGIEQGIVLPKPLAEKLLPQFQAHIVTSAEQSLFYSPIKQLPADFSAEQKQQLTKQYSALI